MAGTTKKYVPHLNRFDKKIPKLFKLVDEIADELKASAASAATLMENINTFVDEMEQKYSSDSEPTEEQREELDEEIRKEFSQDIIPLLSKLVNRIERVAKNHKALGGVVAALNAVEPPIKEKD